MTYDLITDQSILSKVKLRLLSCYKNIFEKEIDKIKFILFCNLFKTLKEFS